MSWFHGRKTMGLELSEDEDSELPSTFISPYSLIQKNNISSDDTLLDPSLSSTLSTASTITYNESITPYGSPSLSDPAEKDEVLTEIDTAYEPGIEIKPYVNLVHVGPVRAFGSTPSVLLDEMNTLIRTPNGIAFMRVKDMKKLDMNLFITSITKSNKGIAMARVQQLMKICGGLYALHAVKFVTLCAIEFIQAYGVSDFVTLVSSGARSANHFRASIVVDRFVQYKPTQNEELFSYCLYRLDPSMVENGLEDKLIREITNKWNAKKTEDGSPPNEILRPIFVDFMETSRTDTKLLSSPPFEIRSFTMWEETPNGLDVLANLDLSDWTLKSTSYLSFFYRPGEIFVYTMSTGMIVIEDYIDYLFPVQVSLGLMEVPQGTLLKSIMFMNRHKYNDHLLTIHILSQLLRNPGTLDC